MKIIGLCGEKGSGKDTVYEIISKHKNSKRFAFADPLKEALKKLFLWDDCNFSRDNKEKIDEYWGVSPRQMCQVLGTDVLRNYLSNLFDMKINDDGKDYSFHIKRINKEFNELSESYDFVIFTDVRFLDELRYVKGLGGKIYMIERPGLEKNKYSNHESEKNIDDNNFINEVDFIIDNDCDLNSLEEKVISNIIND